jgi:Arc/MetJ family transcription regulator
MHTMRTTLNLPEELINETMLAVNLPTKTATILMALDQLIRRSKTMDIMQYGGKIDLDIDLTVLCKR